eukprot:gene6858-7074_t
MATTTTTEAPKSKVNESLLVILHGKRVEDALLRDAITSLKAQGHKISVRVTFDRGDVEAFIAEAVRLNAQGTTSYQTIVAGGGDGTLNEVVVALLQHRDAIERQGLSVALLPLGTANDFACVTGISVDPMAALELALDPATIKPIDVATVNGRPFVNTAVVGRIAAFSPEELARQSRLKRLFGPAAIVVQDDGLLDFTLLTGDSLAKQAAGWLSALAPGDPDEVVSDSGICQLKASWLRVTAASASAAAAAGTDGAGQPGEDSLGEAEGLAPAPRGGHAVTAVGNSLLLFGGADRSPQAHDDLWQLKIGHNNTAEWTRISCSFPSSVACTARSGAALVTVKSHVYLFGGQEPNTGICFNDVLELDPHTWTWRQLQVEGLKPPARHSCVAVAFKDQCLLVYGGAGLQGPLGDVWLFNCQQQSWSCPHIHTSSSSQPLPTAREMAAGVMLDADRLLVFGGRCPAGRVLDDVIILDTRDDWSWTSSSHTQFRRCAHTLVALAAPQKQQQPAGVLSEGAWTAQPLHDSIAAAEASSISPPPRFAHAAASLVGADRHHEGGLLAGPAQAAEAVANVPKTHHTSSDHLHQGSPAPRRSTVPDDQLLSLDSEGALMAAEGESASSAAVSTRAGPEADPYHLGAGGQ